MKRILLLSATLMFITLSAAQADSTLEPGLWKTTIAMQMSGMPFAPTARTYEKCVTTKDATLTIKALAEEATGTNCTLSDYSFDGENGHWTTQCLGRRASTSDNQLHILDPHHYQLKSSVDLADTGGGVMKITSQFERLGDCK